MIRYLLLPLTLLSFFLLPLRGMAQVADTVQQEGLSVQANKDSVLPLPPPKGTKAHLYRMNYWVSGGITVAGTVANILSIPRIKAKEDITLEALNGLQPSAMNSFERMALNYDPAQAEKWDKRSDVMLNVLVFTPLTLGLDKAIRKDALRIFVMYAEMHSITFSLYNFSPFGPTFQNKYRPTVYYKEIPTDVRVTGNNMNSQYSGHTASAAAATFFMAKVYNDYHPEFSSGKKYLIYGLASIPPLVEGYFRMVALKHFPADILMGFVVGATCGIAVPEMHRFKRQAIRYGLTTTPVGPGAYLSWNIGARY